MRLLAALEALGAMPSTYHAFAYDPVATQKCQAHWFFGDAAVHDADHDVSGVTANGPLHGPQDRDLDRYNYQVKREMLGEINEAGDNDNSEDKARKRRGRGQRKNEAYWNKYNAQVNEAPFDKRECLFANSAGCLQTPAVANLDTGLKVPGGIIMSARYARHVLQRTDMSTEYVDPFLHSVSGHKTPISGVLRDVVFRLKGASVTFKRDIWVCDAIDGIVDVMLGAQFVAEHFNLLFARVKSLFAGWFATARESEAEKEEREARERRQRREANQQEIARLVNENRQLWAAERETEARQQARSSDSGRRRGEGSAQ